MDSNEKTITTDQSLISKKELKINEHVQLEAQRFYQFIKEIILPYEPKGFKSFSKFHFSLILAACKQFSVNAAPRNHLKSTIISRYRTLHRLIDPYFPEDSEKSNTDIFILSESSDLARSHLSWIKYNIEFNPYLIQRYGQLKPTTESRTPWNQDQIQLTNGNKCTASGYTSQFRGFHPTDVFIDDLESQNNMGTEESLKKLKDTFYRVIMAALDPQANLAYIGTVIARESLLNELLANPEYNGKKWQALTEKINPQTNELELQSLWPERWPVELLLKMKQRLGSHRFNAEFQNEPLGLEDQIINPEWIRRHTITDLAKIKATRRYIGIDPAFTEERWGDFSAVTVLDETQNRQLYERLSWRNKVGLPALVNTIITIYNQMAADMPPNTVFISIEEVAAQKAVRQAIMEKDPNIGGRIIPYHPDKDKVRRLIDVSRFFELGLISFMTPQFIEEILNFPVGVKDRVDSLVIALKLYEKQHGAMQPGEYSEIDTIERADDIMKEILIMKAFEDEMDGRENLLPNKWKKVYIETQALSEYFDNFN